MCISVTKATYYMTHQFSDVNKVASWDLHENREEQIEKKVKRPLSCSLTCSVKPLSCFTYNTAQICI